MSTTPQNHQIPSPESSNEDQEPNSTPPPLHMPPEIRIFQQQNYPENGMTPPENQPHPPALQTPTLNSKKSFCIDALLAKNQDENENDRRYESRRSSSYFHNNNYKDNVISRDLNSSPEDRSR